MERGNTKHGPRLDEEMQREVRGMLQGSGAGSSVDEWLEPEPAGEDLSEVPPPPDGSTGAGAPPEMTEGEADQGS